MGSAFVNGAYEICIWGESSANPPGGSWEEPVINCTSRASSSWVKLVTIVQNHSKVWVRKKKPYELKLELKNTLATISTPFGPLHFHPSISLSGPFISSRKLRAILQTSTTSRQNYETKQLWAVKEIINILKILRIGNPSSWFPLLLIGLEHSRHAPSQPVRCKTRTNSDLIIRVFLRFRQFVPLIDH